MRCRGYITVIRFDVGDEDSEERVSMSMSVHRYQTLKSSARDGSWTLLHCTGG